MYCLTLHLCSIQFNSKSIFSTRMYRESHLLWSLWDRETDNIFSDHINNDNVISLTPCQTDHIKRLPLYFKTRILNAMFYNSMLALLWWIAIYPIASNSSLSHCEYPLLKYKSISYSGLVEEKIKKSKRIIFYSIETEFVQRNVK